MKEPKDKSINILLKHLITRREIIILTSIPIEISLILREFIELFWENFEKGQEIHKISINDKEKINEYLEKSYEKILNDIITELEENEKTKKI